MKKIINYDVDFCRVNDNWITKGQRTEYYRTTPKGETSMKVFLTLMLIIFIACLFTL